MKVKDLLAALQGVDPEQEVWVASDPEGNEYRPLHSVERDAPFVDDEWGSYPVADEDLPSHDDYDVVVILSP